MPRWATRSIYGCSSATTTDLPPANRDRPHAARPPHVHSRRTALKTPHQYLDEIRARKIRIFYRGQRFDNAVDHPVASPAARCVAETYAAALEPGAVMAVESPLIGESVNVSNRLWRSRDDLIARVHWERLIGRRTGRGALRSPGLDAINALAVVTHACDRARGTGYHPRLLAFVERIQRDDLAVSGAMTDVRGDRSRRPGAQR
jgi:4-hydroxybutyryl-CoA dehydratase / vinylacetyl-CoA-Delta-isomerase